MFEQSLDQQQEVGNKHAVASLLSILGRVMCYLQYYDRARILFAESLTFQERGDPNNVAYTLEGLAGWAVAQGRADQAAHLLGVSDTVRETCGAWLLPHDRPDYETTVAAVRAQLRADSFATAWAAGRTMSVEQVVTLTLEQAR